MNAPIARLFGLVLVLFLALIAFTSRWTVFEARELNDRTENKRPLLEEQRIPRGRILAADGSVLARSVPAGAGTYRRAYPNGGLFAHAVGYSDIDLGRAGLERSRNDVLTGDRDQLTTILDQLRGRRREGDDLATALDPAAQRVALAGLAGRAGSVVALDPRTGRVRVMASLPGFDPDAAIRAGRFSAGAGISQLNRATQAAYPPGSTFKVVTAAAALDSGAFTPASILDGRSPVQISGVPLRNFADEQFGRIDLTTALTNSVNTVWAQVGERLGIGTMARYMGRFGLSARPRLDYPADQLAISGSYGRDGGLLDPRSGAIDVGRMAIGQDRLRVTPLQMAMVTAAVANGGVLMRPSLSERSVDRDGRVHRFEPRVQARVMKPGTAAQLTAMMARVVREGTGTAAALAGVQVAGKTGTAEVDVVRGVTQPWFIGFAPVERPRVAIAVTLERQTGTGGIVAAPIAKRVLEALLK